MELLSEALCRFKGVQEGTPISFIDRDRLRELLGKAQKFVLDDDIAKAVGSVCLTKPSSTLRDTEFARTPFPVTWFEVAYLPLWANGLRELDTGRYHPKRLGYLLFSDEKGESGIFHMFWQFADDTLGGSPIAMVYDMSNSNLTSKQLGARYNMAMGLPDISWGSIEREKAKEILKDEYGRFKGADTGKKEVEAFVTLANKFICVVSTLYGKLWRMMADGLQREIISYDQYDKEIESWIKDYDGEPNHLVAMLCFLNTKNSVEFEQKDRSADSLRRTRKGKAPLHSYKILKLKLTKQQIVRARSEGVTDLTQMRYHLVRGHWKNRKTGRFWWANFGRGDLGRGIVEKDYELV